MGGIVDQDVEPAEARHRALDESLAVRLLADVPRKKHGGAARLLDPASGLASVVLLAQVRDQDVGPLAGIGNGDRPSDPEVGAGDDRDPTGSRP